MKNGETSSMNVNGSTGPQIGQPEWRGLGVCDFCGEALQPADQLAGACPNCASVIEEQDETN